MFHFLLPTTASLESTLPFLSSFLAFLEFASAESGDIFYLILSVFWLRISFVKHSSFVSPLNVVKP
jgi:hypothetical protein